MEKKIRSARLAEIQAIAIYEAEVFWIRHPVRRAVLRSILDEERAHDASLETYGVLSPPVVYLSRLAGWVLGSALAMLPWKWMCRFQARAEEEAARIYERAASETRSDPALRERLEKARAQESDHAARFLAWSRGKAEE